MINSFSMRKAVMISLVIMVVGLFLVNKQLSNAEGKDHMHSLKISQMSLYTSDAKSFTTTKKSANDIEITRNASEITNTTLKIVLLELNPNALIPIIDKKKM